MEGATTNGPSDVKMGIKYESPKPWFKLTEDEKIERLREVIKQSQHSINRIYNLENRIQKLRTLLSQHSHTESGVSVKMTEYDNIDNFGEKLSGSNSVSQNPEDVYF